MYRLISFIRRSRIKGKILKLLLFEPMTPMDIKKSLNTHRESVSRALLDMEKRDLVKCVNPEEHNFRYYAITDKGKEVMGLLEKKK